MASYTNIKSILKQFELQVVQAKHYTKSEVYTKNEIDNMLSSCLLDKTSDTTVNQIKKVPTYGIGCLINKYGGAVTSIKSYGANFINLLSYTTKTSSVTISNEKINFNTAGPVVVQLWKDTATFYSEPFPITSGGSKSSTFTKSSDINYIRIKANYDNREVWYNISSLPNGTYTMSCDVSNYSSTCTLSNIMLEYGSTATGYKKYRGIIGTITIANSIINLTGYGWNIDSTSKYNYVDFENKQYVRLVGRRSYQTGDSNNSNVKTDGTYTYYMLSTPIVTDISEYITTNKLWTEEGGIIYFNNEANSNIPNDVDYLLEVA